MGKEQLWNFCVGYLSGGIFTSFLVCFPINGRQSRTIIPLQVSPCWMVLLPRCSPRCWQHGWLILAAQLSVPLPALRQVRDGRRAGIPPGPMPVLAQAFPLYQEGPCPVATMPRQPGLAPAVCGTWSGAKSAQEAAAGRSAPRSLWSGKTGGSWMGLTAVCVG